MRLVAIALVLGLAATARADDPSPSDELAEAIRLEAALEYDQALAIVTRVINRGTTTDPQQLAELHFLAGRLAGGLDRSDEARDHFARALALKPDLALPQGTSPKLLAPFEQAHATLVALRVHASPDGKVVADADPLAMVVRSEVHGTDARAFDNHGNVVWRGTVLPEQPPPLPPSPASRPIAARWSTWAIATGGLAVASGLCAWRFQAAQDDWNQFSQDGHHDYTQLRAIEQRGQRWAIAADVGFGLTAAAGVTALVLNLREDFKPRVMPLVSPSSVGLAVGF